MKREHHDDRPLYSLGLQKTVVLVGLGNIGKDYDGTRHNIGFACVDAFAQANDAPKWIDKKDLQASVTSLTLGDTRVVLAKPTTMMNLSGEAVSKILNFYKVPASQLLVVHDELDIDFGQIRTRVGGSSAGNNGIKSIIHHVGEEFGRIRVGTKNKFADSKDSADFVLDKFSKDEQEHLKALTSEVGSLLNEYIFKSPLPAETRSFIL